MCVDEVVMFQTIRLPVLIGLALSPQHHGDTQPTAVCTDVEHTACFAVTVEDLVCF